MVFFFDFILCPYSTAKSTSKIHPLAYKAHLGNLILPFFWPLSAAMRPKNAFVKTPI